MKFIMVSWQINNCESRYLTGTDCPLSYMIEKEKSALEGRKPADWVCQDSVNMTASCRNDVAGSEAEYSLLFTP